MAPRLGASEPPIPVEAGMNSPPDELNLTPVITEETHSQKRPPMKIVWRNVILMAMLHSASVYAMTLIFKVKLLTILWTVLVYQLSALGITAGAHRLWAHRGYKAKLPLRIFLAFCNSMAFQNDVIEWARDHRVHHKFSETDADPHNAKRGFFFAHIGWLLVRKHPDVKAKGKDINLSDLLADPVLRFQRKVYKTSVILCCFVFPTVVPHYLWGESLWNAYFLSAILRYCLTLNATWLVNSLAHIWGNKPYDKRINPVESRIVSFWAIGEGFHNYHHVFPQDYATGEFGWYFNPTCMFLDTAAFFGQVYDRKTIPKDVIQRRKEKYGDGSYD